MVKWPFESIRSLWNVHFLCLRLFQRQQYRIVVMYHLLDNYHRKHDVTMVFGKSSKMPLRLYGLIKLDVKRNF